MIGRLFEPLFLLELRWHYRSVERLETRFLPDSHRAAKSRQHFVADSIDRIKAGFIAHNVGRAERKQWAREVGAKIAKNQ